MHPLARASELGDVPRPELVGPGGQQLGFLVLGVPQLIAALAYLVVFGQDPVHGQHRAEEHAFVEQGRMGFRWSEVGEPIGVQHRQDLLALGRGERAHRLLAHRSRRHLPDNTTMPILHRAREPQGPACRRTPHGGCERPRSQGAPGRMPSWKAHPPNEVSTDFWDSPLDLWRSGTPQ